MHAADLAAAVDALPYPQRTHRIALEARRLLGTLQPTSCSTN